MIVSPDKYRVVLHTVDRGSFGENRPCCPYGDLSALS